MSFLLAANFSSLATVSRDTKHAQDIMDNIKKIERQSSDDFVLLIFIDVSLSTNKKRLLFITTCSATIFVRMCRCTKVFELNLSSLICFKFWQMFAFQKIDSLSHDSFQLLTMAKFNLTSTLSKIIDEIGRFYTRGRINDPSSHWLVLCVKCKDGIKRVQARRTTRGEQCAEGLNEV